MSATAGAGLGKLTEIADNTDELELIASDIEINTDGSFSVVIGYEVVEIKS